MTLQNFKFYAALNLCLLLAIFLWVKTCENKKLNQAAQIVRIPDTVYINKLYKEIVIQKEYIQKPIKVYVYLKDTTLRNKVEKETIITGIEFTRKNLFQNMDMIKISKIDTAGLIMTDEFKLKPFRAFSVDGLGNLEAKPKRYLGLKIGTGIVIGIGTALLIQQLYFKK
jgi:hypothetical protein